MAARCGRAIDQGTGPHDSGAVTTLEEPFGSGHNFGGLLNCRII
jgi:hypothetical protein